MMTDEGLIKLPFALHTSFTHVIVLAKVDEMSVTSHGIRIRITVIVRDAILIRKIFLEYAATKNVKNMAGCVIKLIYVYITDTSEMCVKMGENVEILHTYRNLYWM